MQRVTVAVFILGLVACAQSEGASATPEPMAETGAETPMAEAASTEAEVDPAPCARNSSEVCECADGASGLHVCLEGTWNDCECEEGGFDNDDLAFDDE